jgi:hypothetical protein
LIRENIIQYQDMKDPLQQSYRNIALGSEAFIKSSISLHFLWLRLTNFSRWITQLFLRLPKDSSKKAKPIIK